ncbi:MAG: arylesterase [Candidatus Margulisiibacteriota bacterium]
MCLLLLSFFQLKGFTNTTVTFLGDSLTAGYQLSVEDAFPKQLEKLMGTSNITAINRGISGDTSYTLLNRLAFSLIPTPDIAFIAIGANDGLRGMPLKNTKQNILKIIQHLKEKKINVILAGMTLPENYTQTYISDFEQIYAELSKQTQTKLMPFLLIDVAGIPSLNLTDGIHPNKVGHQKIAESIFQFLKTENIISSKNQWQMINQN